MGSQLRFEVITKPVAKARPPGPSASLICRPAKGLSHPSQHRSNHMAINQLAYVESWDRQRFSSVPTRRLSLEELRASMPSSHGHSGIGREEFPFRREWSGLVSYNQDIVVTVDEAGEPWVLSGHEAVASAITESWCSDNPKLFVDLIDGWIKDANTEAASDRDSSREEQKAIEDHPKLADALARNAGKVFQRAALSDREIRVFELRFDRQKSLIEIGQNFSVSKEMVRQIIDKAIDKILALDTESATG